VFRGGVFYPEGATLHPARLARELRAAVIDAGVQLFENTAMLACEQGSENRITTSGGEVIARDVVLATNVHLARDPVVGPHVGPHVTVFSSFALMTDAAPERVEAAGWHGDQGFGDGRMFVHYFSKTPDGRVLMGSGSGPISYGGSAMDPKLTTDTDSAHRAERGLRRLLPSFNGIRVAKAWGGGIDVSADRLPFFRTVPRSRVHYACGFSGHGVNPTYIAGQCLASLVLGQKNDWTSLPFCTRPIAKLPPEPFRSWGGRAVRWGILRCEEAEEEGRRPPPLALASAALPRVLGLKIGTR
jgi:glycine/D-amino acid oxidase-like deaminating enzyme